MSQREEKKSLILSVEVVLDVENDDMKDRRAWFESHINRNGSKRVSVSTHKHKPIIIFTIEGKRHELDVTKLTLAIIENL